VTIGANALVNGDWTLNSADWDIVTGSRLDFQSTTELKLRSGATLDIVAGATVGIDADASITGDWTMSGTSKFDFAVGTELEISSGATLDVDGNFDVDGNTTFDGTTDFNTSAGATNFNGTTNLAGTTQATTKITCSGTGRVVRRLYYNATDGNLNLGIEDCDIVYNPLGVFSANHVLTLNTTGATDGDVMQVTTTDPNWTLTVGGVVMKFAAGSFFQTTFVYSATTASWLRLGGCPHTP
jgi:hypothetical protein